MLKRLKNLKNKKGFTLIELMITVSIIAILSGIVLQVLNPQALRAKTRDKQRIADLKRIQAGLELYFADNRVYPNPHSWADISGVAALSSYMNPVPQDPSGASSPYLYNSSDGSTYTIVSQVEITSSGNGVGCSSTDNYDPCYGVTNP
ncbi:prepilin-type N-terminal cleavage/methylation domain-containing protein [candidate division WWE3 bacterium]|nr:prepilin-type N-terminal cleavage/methylation domain-containing protein [candidate division WWE3 bacterium]